MSNNLHKELFDFNIDSIKKISVTKNEIYNQLLLYIFLKYNKNCISLEEYKEALDVAMSEAQKDDLIVVSGSLYMIGDMRKIINNL